MTKYYAVKPVNVNGIHYNPGDIVETNFRQDGLMLANVPISREIKNAYLNPLFCSGKPAISIVITFHNQEQFVRRCLSAFRRQTIELPYEVIAVIDKSQQGEEGIIKNEYPEVKYVKIDAGNVSKARNAGLRMTTGEYVGFFDGDDYPFPEYLNKLHKALIEHPECNFAYSRFEHKRFGYRYGNLPRCGVFEWSDSWNKISPICNTPSLIRRAHVKEWDERLEIMTDAGHSLRLKNGFHVREELWYYEMGGMWDGQDVAEKKAKALKILTEEYGLSEIKAEVTFASLISRDHVLDEYFSQIPTLGLPAHTHWFIIIDSKEEEFINRVKGLIGKYEKLFQSTRIFVTNDTPLVFSKEFEPRGMRVANMIKIILNQLTARMGGTKYLFMVEDDTLAPKNAFPKLRKMIDKDDNIAYVSGVECGRGWSRHTGVCWLRLDEKGEVVGRDIPVPKKKGVVSIQGGGWYCWVARHEAMRTFLKQCTFRCTDGKMLGPDVMFVYDLKALGYECLANFAIPCKHYDPKGKRWLDVLGGRGFELDYYKDATGSWKINYRKTFESPYPDKV